MDVIPRPPDLKAFLATCVDLGNDLALVQGAGGNLSVKFDGVLWIKASGTRLSQAEATKILVRLDELTVRSAALLSEDLSDARLDDPESSSLRPSIETALHVLMPHVYVVHVHSVAAIAAGLSDAGVGRFTSLNGDFDRAVVPYAKPGIELARAVAGVLGSEISPDRPMVMLLRNHGLVVAASRIEEASRLVKFVETSLRRSPLPEPLEHEALGHEAIPLFPAGTVSPRATRVLAGGAVTPDSAVFLTGVPFSVHDSDSPGRIDADGSITLSASAGADEREIAVSLVDVARQVAENDDVQYLSEDDVNQLTNWEAEKWRKKLKR